MHDSALPMIDFVRLVKHSDPNAISSAERDRLGGRLDGVWIHRKDN